MTTTQTDLLSLVNASPLLSQAEREYWREHLPRMSPEQCEKLTRILSQAKDIAWQRNPQTFLTLLKRTNAVLEKHLSPTRQ